MSLGSYGSQAAFSSPADVSARATGAVWAGTPSFTTLHSSITAGRDPGSPQIHPVVTTPAAETWSVRWGTENGGDQHLDDLGQAGHPHIVYLQHPSDGVVWWWFDVAWSEPDWIAEPPGQDVLPGMRWWPVITGLQLMADQFVAGSPSVPLGYGHNYGEEYVDAWSWVTEPAGWDAGSLADLRELVAGLPR
ncbi:alpha/beta-hydrolase family protein [Salana multivorans]